MAENRGLAELSISEVTSAAGVAKGTFYVHFPDRDAVIVALHRRFHDDLFTHILQATGDLAPGAARLEARLTAFLDACRRSQGVRAMLLDARALPLLRDERRRRDGAAAAVIADDLRAIRPTGHESATAHLLVAATVEVADRELHERRRMPALRAALLDLV